MASASSSIVSTSSQLPTSSTSPPPPLTLWDVFISFRGIDTRYTFTDHLYKALQHTGIRTFMDDPELRSGDVISDGLIQAIQNSKVYVVVFSKNYASSTWCLDELVEILNCHKTMQKLVIPVYHNIDSSVVRHQTKSFKSAFKKHERRPKFGFLRRVSEKDTFHTAAKLEQIEKWRHTLSEVAGFSGQTITAQRNEADIVDEIVEKILIEINPITLHVAKYPVGLDSHVENITALMSSHPGVTKIGIYGMGGVGKTTLAKAVYNQNYRRFQGSCFLENVRESSVTTRGLVCLQQQLIDNVLKCKNINIDNVNHGIELIRARISSIKVLIVFDDLDDPRSMEFLEGKFALGSIILITTRNEDLLDLINVEAKYKVNELGDAESRQLFAQHAFGDNIISFRSTKSFEEILEHAGGLPLALEVFGSNLLNQSEESWTHFSDELKQVSLDVVERKLMISFDALKSVDPMSQGIFLDIACFFMGWNVEEVVKIMETCYTFLSHNIDILKKRSLLTINNRDELGMHDLLRNMGRKIVRNSSPNEPGKHSRLWVSKDICHVLKKHLGTEAIQGIISSNFNHQDALEGVSFNTETFKRMSKLRFLKLNKVKLFGSFEQKFGNLRWLCWDGCPLKYLPLEFYPQKLVILELPHSKIGTMGKLNKVFEKLKTLNMKHSLDLTTTPNFNQFPHLEALNFEHCESLEEVHMSIGSLERLVILNLHGCVNLRSLPGSICNLRALKSLNIGGCISLKELPIELGNLESLRELNAEHLTVVKLPDSIGRLSKLVELGLNHNKNLKTLPDSICNLRSLNSLHIAGCSGLEELPKELGKIESLTKLNAWGLTVSELPDSINCLSKLVELNLNDNKYLEIPPSSLSASGSAPTNRDVLSLREKTKVNDLIDGNKKASEGGSAARKFTYSEVPRNSEMTSNKQVKFSDTISSIEMDDPDMEGQQIGRDPSANWSSSNSPYTADDHITSYSPYLPPVLEEPSSSFKDDDPLPAVEGLQISGEPYPGRELQASGYSINGTTSCNFEWVRHLEDGSVNYIDGAKQPNYLVSADDVDNYLAIEVQPMDDRKRKGELVKVFANENRKIACDPEMHNIIRRNLEAGQASFRISQSVGFLDMWEPAILVVKKEGFNIKGTGSSTSLVTEKFSSATSVIVPCGHPTEFSIISGGNEHLLQAENSPDDIGGARDTIVLTLRLFILRGAFGASHQQALAQVTVQALQSNSQPQNQLEYPSSSAAPAASFPQFTTSVSNTSAYQQMLSSMPDRSLVKQSSELSQSDVRSQPFLTVDKPADDGYNWRKYGQKHVKGSEYPRSYYKCTHSNCPVKKIVERALDGQVTEIVYKGQHNHQPPRNTGLVSEHQTGKWNDESSAYPLSSKDQELSLATHEHFSGSSDSEEVADSKTRVFERIEDEPEAKRGPTEVRVIESAASHRTVTEPRIVVQTTTEVNLLDDGFRWRKYAQKVVQGNPYPRSYYKCASAGCNVRKHVERAASDPKAVITTYVGKHKHDVPPAKNSSHNTTNNHLLLSKPSNIIADRGMEFPNNNQQSVGVLRFKEDHHSSFDTNHEEKITA